MAQKFVVVGRKKPGDPDSTVKYYAQAKSNRNVTIDEICERTSERSSYSTGELMGAVKEFLIEMRHVLQEGNIAELGALGNFSLSVRTGQPTEKAEDFKASNIKDAKVRFYPEKDLRNLCKTVTFELMKITASGSTGSETQEPDEEGGGGL